MKKLFFTALVAMVAVGGAFAAGPFYLLNENTPRTCPGDTGDCSIGLGKIVAYTVSKDSQIPQDENTEVLLSDYSYDL